MKSAVAFCAFIFAAVVLARPNEQYTTKYDNINVSEVLGNKRLLDGYIKCIMDQGKCTTEGKELKAHVGDALETGCSKCSKPQQAGTEQVIRHLVKHEPQAWEQLKAKYDPQNKYSTKYEEQLTKITA